MRLEATVKDCTKGHSIGTEHKFHLVNTLKTNKGAQSGKVLQSYVIEKLNYIKKNYSKQIHVIAGGGITSIQDINLYKQYGAESFSLGTVNFNPWKTKQIIRDYTE